jgi:hypothetical protein
MSKESIPMELSIAVSGVEVIRMAVVRKSIPMDVDM